jgi:DNA-directed RNA polymerase specialized sigma24 family protein
MGSNYGDLFADWEMAVAKQAISGFQARNPRFKGLHFEDLLQECLIHWLLQRSKFQPSRGASVRTYMVKVLYNRLQEILRGQLTDRRKVFHLAESLDQPRDVEGNSPWETNADSENSLDIVCAWKSSSFCRP